ncbi:Nuclear body protein SP140-like protein [Myotis davidii]|uniref:Nuclear body protein SP140-like protein n=1 Tax=Myotis davidii TaxID=225400 RepID=L5M2I6_MYODS|nr:Nuclear body protein SP140-like protein [Myotis davidii]
MSEEEKRIYDVALCHFKRQKVAISHIIKVTFPFLELLRDYGFINNEMYEKSKESFKTPGSETEVIYHVLDEVEKTFNLSLLEALFSKDIMNSYRGLNDIYKIFKKVIPNIEQFLRSGEENEERPDIGQSLEQGTAPPVKGLSEQHHETQEINVNETGTTSDNNDALENRQRNEQCAHESDQEVIDSEDSRESSDGDVPPKASSSALKSKSGTMDFGNNSISERAKKRRRTKMHMDETVDFKDEILPVTCGEMVGMLIKRKLKRGATVKCIRREDGNWYTPREFEVAGGYEKSSNWKNSVYCGGTALKNLKELKNAEKCKICGDEGKLFNCCRCFSFFHEDCHIPPVDPKSSQWKCTFCAMKMSSRSQQCYSESEVRERQLGPEEKLFQKASQCLKTLKDLDEIKDSLNKECYSKVEEFVHKVNNIFQDPKQSRSYCCHSYVLTVLTLLAPADSVEQSGSTPGSSSGCKQGRHQQSVSAVVPGPAAGMSRAHVSNRVSAEDENIENKHINDIAFTYFKKYKVEISGAITTTFPFLELIRDRGFITNEMYEKSQESFKKRFSVHEVIYDILSELEKKFDMSILQALFSKIIMDKYPDLLRIYKIFYKVIPDIKSSLESGGEENEERLNEQLSLEQAEVREAPFTAAVLTSHEPGSWLSSAPTVGAHRPPVGSSCIECLHPGEINSEDSRESSDGGEPPEASTSALKREPGVPRGQEAGTESSQASDIRGKAKPRSWGGGDLEVTIDDWYVSAACPTMEIKSTTQASAPTRNRPPGS